MNKYTYESAKLCVHIHYIHTCTHRHTHTHTHTHIPQLLGKEPSSTGGVLSSLVPGGSQVTSELFNRLVELHKSVYEYIEDMVSHWASEGSEVTALRRQVAKLQVRG